MHCWRASTGLLPEAKTQRQNSNTGPFNSYYNGILRCRFRLAVNIYKKCGWIFKQDQSLSQAVPLDSTLTIGERGRVWKVHDADFCADRVGHCRNPCGRHGPLQNPCSLRAAPVAAIACRPVRPVCSLKATAACRLSIFHMPTVPTAAPAPNPARPKPLTVIQAVRRGLCGRKSANLV